MKCNYVINKNHTRVNEILRMFFKNFPFFTNLRVYKPIL